MRYQVKDMSLEPIREIYSGCVNDVLICEDISSSGHSYYTVMMIKDHMLAKEFLHIVSGESRRTEPCYIDVFTCSQGFGVVFEYIKERYLEDFYMGEQFSLTVCETICMNLIMECMSSVLPYPLLYLCLQQKQIHMRMDNSIQLGCPLDITGMDGTIGEEACVGLCASILRDLLVSKARQKADSYQLLSKRIAKDSYQSFKDLYYDVKMAAEEPRKHSIRVRIRGFFYRNQQVLFRILLWVSAILFVLAVIGLIFQLTTGDVPFLRFFVNTFKKIGTESLSR